MSTTIKPIIFKCQETPGYLSSLESKIKSFAGKDADLLLEYPVVYLHVWKNKTDSYNGTYHVYVGEADNVVRRQGEHWAAAVDPKYPNNWQHKMANDKDEHGKTVISTLYVIGHPNFHKSMTLDIEDRLMVFCLAMQTAVTQNGRFNHQGKYKGDDCTDAIFGYIWKALKKDNPNLFLPESEIMKSAIYKASPNHKLTDDQKKAKNMIIDRVYDALLNGKDHQLVMVEGEAGTGKTVLTSSTFYDLLRKVNSNEEIESSDLRAYLLVNHDEQVNVYSSMATQMGYGEIALKPQKFINSHNISNPVDVAFVDEAHLLMKQGKMGQKPDMLRNIMDRARVTVIMFDRYQILRRQQFIEPSFIQELVQTAENQGNYIPMVNQLRMNCDKKTMEWIDSVTKKQVIPKLSRDSKGYEIKVFDTPKDLHDAIKNKVKDAKDKDKIKKHPEIKADELSRLIASYDWPYKGTKRPEAPQEYWEVQIPKDKPTWSLVWNRELINYCSKYTSLPRRTKMRINALDWAEQDQTIDEVGSIYTIQGFDLAYAGVIIGPSIYYDPNEKRIKINKAENCCDDMKGSIKTSDGTDLDVEEFLIKNELRVLLTRGTKGLYIYACDLELRKALVDALK